MMNFLIWAVIILGIIVLGKLIRVFELSRDLKESNEEEISLKDNKMNASMMMLFVIGFFIFTFYYIISYKDKLLPPSASVHGESIDTLLNFNFLIIMLIFVITHIFLFYFAFKYYYKKDYKPTWFPHNNKLEIIWTIVPAVLMAIIIVYGLQVWTSVTDDDDPEYEDALVIELYSKQFDWTARYGGSDGQLGQASHRLIKGANVLGLDSSDNRSNDDVIVKGEFHLPVNKPVKFIFRSQDVIHSAYMPHFRAQMNTVPGMTTTFHFTPKITTVDMRNDPMVKQQYEQINEKRRNNSLEEVVFNFVLLCNKICGASHYNMQMDIIVETEEEFNSWLSEQKTFIASVPGNANEELNQLAETNK